MIALLALACAPVMQHTRPLPAPLAEAPAWSPAPPVTSEGLVIASLAFPCGEDTCAGTLYRPAEGGPAPVVVMAHGFTGERDMALPEVAKGFAAQGLAAFTFDYRGWGDSGGLPRYTIVAERQVEDYLHALAFVRTLPEVDGARVATWGTSFSGGHALMAAARDGGVQAVVSQVPVVNGLAEPPQEHEPELIWPLVRLSFKDKLRELRGGERLYVPAYADEGEVGFITGPEAVAARDALVPEGSRWPDLVAPAILIDFDEYHPHREARDLDVPVLFLLATGDVYVSNAAARKLAEDMPRARVVEVPGGHFEVYAGEPLAAALAVEGAFLVEALGVERALAVTRP